MPKRIDAKGEPLLVFSFLIDNRNPVPGIGVQRHPRVHCEAAPANRWSVPGGYSDPGRIPVKPECTACNTRDVTVKSAYLAFGVSGAVRHRGSMILMKRPVGNETMFLRTGTAHAHAAQQAHGNQRPNCADSTKSHRDSPGYGSHDPTQYGPGKHSPARTPLSHSLHHGVLVAC